MATRELNKGDSVEIFGQPLTEKESLGIGTLVFKYGANHGYYKGRTVEHWGVSFEGEEGTFTYSILV